MRLQNDFLQAHLPPPKVGTDLFFAYSTLVVSHVRSMELAEQELRAARLAKPPENSGNWTRNIEQVFTGDVSGRPAHCGEIKALQWLCRFHSRVVGVSLIN